MNEYNIYMEDHYKYKVLVSCLTYNHSAYIKDALEGFCMQKTNFPFVCIIIDDASTDGEQGVLLDYLKNNFELGENSIARSEETDDYVETYARHKTNESCYFVVLLLKKNHYSIGKTKRRYFEKWQRYAKYIATCEGDDYWTSPLKLQKQYDYMESHSGFSLCFHPDYRLYSDGTKIEHRPRISKDIYSTKDVVLLDGGLMATGSMLFRSVDLVYGEERPKFWTNAPVGDEPLRLYLSTKGHIGYINEIMSVYRMASIGSWTSKNLSLRFWTKHIKGMNKMYTEFDIFTKHHFHYYILIAKCILGIKYVKGVWEAVLNKFCIYSHEK